MEMKAEYKGFNVEWLDFSKRFIITQDGAQLKECRDLEACEKWIDKTIKQKWKRVKVLFDGDWRTRDAFLPGVATSVIDDEYVWVSDAEKNRSKNNIKSVWLDNEANRNLVSEFKRHSEQIRDLQEENHMIKKEMEQLTVEVMKLPVE